jgi:hypothetical protein
MNLRTDAPVAARSRLVSKLIYTFHVVENIGDAQNRLVDLRPDGLASTEHADVEP